MGYGYLRVAARMGDDAIPVAGAQIDIFDSGGAALHRLPADENGITEEATLSAPDKGASLDPQAAGPRRGLYEVHIAHPRCITQIIRNAEVYDGVSSTLPVRMLPATDAYPNTQFQYEVTVPPPAIETDCQSGCDAPPEQLTGEEPLSPGVAIPDYITVHMGPPDNASARNMRVRFADYLANVCAGELYATWPAAALEANLYAQMSLALNRIHTGWYRSRGMDFDVTNSACHDQAYHEGRAIPANIARLAYELTGSYCRRRGSKEPYYTAYCSGRTAVRHGLAQWDSVELARQGHTALQILRAYYPRDLELVRGGTRGILCAYPGAPLRTGSTGGGVRTVQSRLSRIGTQYPGIPRMEPDGIFTTGTAAAVTRFQSVFGLPADGTVDGAAWRRIAHIYEAVTTMAALLGEGGRLGVGDMPPEVTLRQGAGGGDVTRLQYLLSVAARYYGSPDVPRDGIFEAQTHRAVRDFQALFGLAADGVADSRTWRMLYDVYASVRRSAPPAAIEDNGAPPPAVAPYPGRALRMGATGGAIRALQRYLNAISVRYPAIPRLAEDGIFGVATADTVRAFQRQFGLTADGIAGAATWAEMTRRYASRDDASKKPPYPGAPLAAGATGTHVRTLQELLDTLSQRYPMIPAPAADGVFGVRTREAVQAFQRQLGLTADGAAGPVSWDRLTDLVYGI